MEPEKNNKESVAYSDEVFSEEFLEVLLSHAIEDFPAIWKELKEEIKNFSEEEKAQRIFEAGALAVLEQLQEKEDSEEDDFKDDGASKLEEEEESDDDDEGNEEE
ncbi:hypothetical protein HYX13_04845 [Candidatus Woesearchaeota archaeon]|nr:hypothetical protein [Candidatus Woesearchaeota archaeon]